MKFSAFKTSLALFTSLAFVVPCAVLAAPVPAGFAPGSLWISKTELVAGDSATFYTVVYDSSAGAIAGDAVFSLDGTTLGSKHFALTAGTTQILSLPWVATEGPHSVLATIENAGSTTPLAGRTTDTIALTVAPAPPPSPQVAAAEAAASGIASATPAVLAFTGTALGAVDSVRQSAIHSVQGALDGPSANPGQVLGVSTYRAPASASSSNSWKQFGGGGLGASAGSAWKGFLTGLLFVLTNDWLFWLSLALTVYIVLRLILLVFRERRRR